MAVLRREELRNQLNRREILPVYVLFGSETYLCDRAAQAIANYCFEDGDLRDFNESEFSLNAEGNLQRAIGAANQLPMMAKKRFIRISDVRISATGHRDTILEDHQSILLEYLRNPSPSSVVVFVADELNGVRTMGKLLRTRTTAVEFTQLSDDDALKWARERFKDARAAIDEVTLRQFTALTGNDAARIENEAEKLATAALPQTVISTDLVGSLVPNSRELSNFDLTDNLVGKDKRRSLSILRKILEDGAEPVMILGLISYNFRCLLIAKSLMSRGADRAEVTRVINLRGRDQEGFLAVARRAETTHLAYAIRRIAAADLAIKSSIGGSGPAGGRMQIETLVAELACL